MRSLQSAEGEVLSESAASALRGEMAERHAGARPTSSIAESAEIVRLRAKGHRGAASSTAR